LSATSRRTPGAGITSRVAEIGKYLLIKTMAELHVLPGGRNADDDPEPAS
jgi:hypothetical protein